ncbi:sensor histidine kinase [Micrococcus lylae]|uniref:Sensor histidine kinase n=1 Tax=Micrococcus lylae TaxID=1273 RepID=A0A1R4I716_9MICC|nr:histidine kinase [Micrococcus lylae]TFH98991.1 sensor histidine kinase [Micrococcus lylae]SJN15549.1 sensor histidine kinase [Micrococcus lylae]
MRIEGNHDDGRSAPPAAAPGRRPTGAVPTASAAGPGASGFGPLTGDLAGAWWYTWTGLLFGVLVIAGYSAFGPLTRLQGHMDAGRTGQAVVLAVLLLLHVLGVVGQLHVARLFQAPPPGDAEGPVVGQRDLAWLFGPTVPLALAGAVLPALGLTELGTWWALPLWLSCLLLSLLVHPRRRRPVAAAGLTVSLILGAAAVLQDPAGPIDTAGGFLLWAVFTGVMIVPAVWFWRVMQRLEHARLQAADLAVTRERLRFASDLHDVQGHHLQVIALKAELAERLLAKGRTEDAGAQLHEVREQAREALAETRALVRDLREVSAERELANARDVLTAAGTHADVHVDPSLGPLGPAAGRLVGLAAREATTNILRHAHAEHARLELTAVPTDAFRLRLVVTNDGAPAVGAADPVDPATSPRPGERPSSSAAADGRRGWGTGLAGLAERAEAAGGTLSAVHEGEMFTLTLTVPRSAEEETA